MLVLRNKLKLYFLYMPYYIWLYDKTLLYRLCIKDYVVQFNYPKHTSGIGVFNTVTIHKVITCK